MFDIFFKFLFSLFNQFFSSEQWTSYQCHCESIQLSLNCMMYYTFWPLYENNATFLVITNFEVFDGLTIFLQSRARNFHADKFGVWSFRLWFWYRKKRRIILRRGVKNLLLLLSTNCCLLQSLTVVSFQFDIVQCNTSEYVRDLQ